MMRQCKQRLFVSIYGCLLWLVLIPIAGADIDGEAQLQSFFDGLRTLNTAFVQEVTDADGAQIQHSEGRMWMQRPGLFRWDYQLPYHQIIVGDGKQVWVYDEDLEQVTVRPFDVALGQTPALLLSSDTPLLESFTVTILGVRDGLDWYLLMPTGRDSVFEELRLGIANGLLRAMELRDGLGHLTALSFTSVTRNESIDPQLFVFVPPEGVDVVRETGMPE